VEHKDADDWNKQKEVLAAIHGWMVQRLIVID